MSQSGDWADGALWWVAKDAADYEVRRTYDGSDVPAWEVELMRKWISKPGYPDGRPRNDY